MVQFNTPAGSADIVFIFLDRISQCQTKWTAEITRNLSDYVLSKINSHGFNVLQGLDEDALLREAAKTYSHAVVLSTGTEFINGDDFFNEVENLVYSNTDFFLMGHIPDRDDGYYELHEQCYIINLKTYSELDYPIVGKFAYYSPHTQIQPLRAEDNVHDDYTPVWVESGNIIKQYKHKWHGWNILSEAFKHDKPVLVFPEQFRKNKRYYYPNYESAFTNACTYLYGKNQVETCGGTMLGNCATGIWFIATRPAMVITREMTTARRGLSSLPPCAANWARYGLRSTIATVRDT
jgi:hypothetical protein